MSRNTFRWKPYIFLFRQWGKVSTFFRKLYDWVVGTAFQLAIASFWEEVSAKIFPPIIFGHLAKPLRDFFEYLSTGLSKLHSSCPEELFELNKFCKSCRVLFITLGLSDKKILLSGKKVRQGCQKAILHYYGTHSRRRFPVEFFLSLSEIDRKIPHFVEKFSSGLSELISTCHKNHDEAEINLKKSF